MRRSVARTLIDTGALERPRLGATVHFGTNEPWERDRFRILNLLRSRLSSNVLARNMRHDYAALEALWRLSHDRAFVLKDRICWSQRMTRGQFLTAMTLLKTAGTLMGHIGPGRSNQIADLAVGLQGIMDKVGPGVFRDNVRTFFDLVDKCWGIQRVAYKEAAIYLRMTFLVTLARVLSDHLDFWRGDRLFVEAPLVRKIQRFSCNDPQVTSLAGSGGKAREMLWFLLVNHINSGKRSKRLRPRQGQAASLPEGDDEDNGD